MTYQEFPPAVQLIDFVKSYWWFDNPPPQQSDLTILPDGCFDLLIHFQQHTIKEISLTGVWTKQVDISIPPDTQIFGIRFKLLAVDYIFQRRIADILDNELQLPINFWQIDQADFSNPKNTTGHFDQIMLSILGTQKGIEPKKKTLFNLLHQTNGEQTIEHYSKQTFWTSRQLNRYFNQRLGISLKKYCNILKVFASLKHIKKGRLYPDCNYFDQSHFIKYVKKHTGNNPINLFENKNDRFLQLTVLPES